jgi:hypothetical protein
VGGFRIEWPTRADRLGDPPEQSAYLGFGQFAALTLIPSKVPLLFGYSHQTGEPPWLHSKNPTNRPLHPLSISMSNAAERSLYAMLLPYCCSSTGD